MKTRLKLKPKKQEEKVLIQADAKSTFNSRQTHQPKHLVEFMTTEIYN